MTGFSTVDLVGQAGLEEQYNQPLRQDRHTDVSVNAAGDVTGTVSRTAGQARRRPGDQPQRADPGDAQNALNAIAQGPGGRETRRHQGAAVVMTTTGRVVAMASYPDYNPSVWTNGISQQQFDDAVRHQRRGADHQPGHPGPVRARVRPGRSPRPRRRSRTATRWTALYSCPASVSIGGHTFKNDGDPNLGDMTFCTRRSSSPATPCSTSSPTRCTCSDNPQGQRRHRAEGPGPEDAEDGAGLGLRPATPASTCRRSRPARCPPGSGCTTTGRTTPTPARTGASTASRTARYVQQIEYQDCQSGYSGSPGQAAIAAIGQGYVTVTPLQLANAYAALANGGTLYSPRIGEALISPATGKVVQKIKPPVVRAPAGRPAHAGLHPQRAGRRGDPGHRGRRLRRVPAEQGLRRGQDRYRRRSSARTPPRCSPRSRRATTRSTWSW